MKRILTALACSCAFAFACNAQMTAARMMAFAPTGVALPSWCERVEYVQSNPSFSSTVYTEHIPTVSVVVECVASAVAYNKPFWGEDHAPIGGHYRYHITPYNGKIYSGTGSQEFSYGDSMDILNKKIFSHFEGSRHFYAVDCKVFTNNTNIVSSPYEILIGSRRGSTGSYKSEGTKFYSFKIIDAGLELNFIPVRLKTDAEKYSSKTLTNKRIAGCYGFLETNTMTFYGVGDNEAFIGPQ